MSLYRYPEVYATLLYPEPQVLDDIQDWIDGYLDGGCFRLMDPCCGPATWLLPFAVRDVFVAGNDLLPAMVDEARSRLGLYDHELIVGDMRSLAFTTGAFDVALNLHSSIGHLPDLSAMAEHLDAVRDHLRPGGLYFLGLCVYDGTKTDDRPLLLYQSDPLPVPSGGTAAVRYESVRRNPVRGEETIRVLLLTHGISDCPERLEDEYVLRTFAAASLRDLVRGTGFELLAVHDMDQDGRPDVGLFENCGDVTLVLRKSHGA